MKLNSIFLALLLSISIGEAAAQNKFNKIDAWLNDNAAQLGGRAILLIYHDDQIVYSHDVNKLTIRASYTPSTRLPIASCSKWLSAALAMTYVDQGRLKLTDTVGKYLPVLSKHGKGNITVAQCLSHLTAIDAPPMGENMEKMKTVSSMDQAIDDIAELPMEGEPGQVFHYSYVGLQIVAAVLEKIEGKNFETLFADRIANPLEMKNTDFGNKAVAQPAGGAFSTAEDYINFLAMILHKGIFKGRRILTEASIKQMQLNQLHAGIKISGLPDEAGSAGYGFGEWVLGPNVVTSPGLFGSYPWVDYDKKYAAVLITFNLKRKGRQQRYLQLRKLVEEAL